MSDYQQPERPQETREQGQKGHERQPELRYAGYPPVQGPPEQLYGFPPPQGPPETQWGLGYPSGKRPPQVRRSYPPEQRRPQLRQAYPPVHLPPVKPYPPDPYIDQFPLPEALYRGTLFRWLYDPYEKPYRRYRPCEETCDSP